MRLGRDNHKISVGDGSFCVLIKDMNLFNVESNFDSFTGFCSRRRINTGNAGCAFDREIEIDLITQW